MISVIDNVLRFVLSYTQWPMMVFIPWTFEKNVHPAVVGCSPVDPVFEGEFFCILLIFGLILSIVERRMLKSLTAIVLLFLSP